MIFYIRSTCTFRTPQYVHVYMHVIRTRNFIEHQHTSAGEKPNLATYRAESEVRERQVTITLLQYPSATASAATTTNTCNHHHQHHHRPTPPPPPPPSAEQHTRTKKRQTQNVPKAPLIENHCLSSRLACPQATPFAKSAINCSSFLS